MKGKESSLLLLALALTSVLMTAIIVNAKPLCGEMALDFYGHIAPPVWRGTISGDINGFMVFFNTGVKDVGQAHHFWEIWEIYDKPWDDPTKVLLIRGTDKGVVTWKNNKYRMNGVVTEATGDWTYLVGHNVHMSGDITWQEIVTPEGPIVIPATAPGEFRVN